VNWLYEFASVGFAFLQFGTHVPDLFSRIQHEDIYAAFEAFGGSFDSPCKRQKEKVFDAGGLLSFGIDKF
jgi:hypothetical protein